MAYEFKNENERFFYQKIDFFSKTMRVGSKSFRGWNKTPKPFRIRWETVAESFSNFEKIDFLWKKKNTHSHFWPHTPFLTKCAFFHQKIDFFQRRWGWVQNHLEAETRPESRSEYDGKHLLKVSGTLKKSIFDKKNE